MKKKDWSIPYREPAVSPALAGMGLAPLLCRVLALRGIANYGK